ncbi:HEPN domain-containing protein [Sphingobium yanoikuyae]|uniref:HEPN domain-containing protein n=1 Tax=Sphingobium yanoikuyae TaxID=13690 RepID=A0A291MXU8_SPHYA|nr:HEPN domain-containing protein [Sphingobium yanoikuyae]ATI79916.1 nucleotidyltransferase [Sphingobium yanoikuyae]MDH2132306.1 HEPN domain-containing protein [Sphingobium yanoikuyae]MDH2150099.1 HEPN domain-containing protein [Sphingobium yanoikuyae]MDH2168791.1 HEPN domain-containing protein [Sphingobium yanoikuyae]
MRTDLDHLPPEKQRELERVVRLLFEEFEDATKNATGGTKDGRILKIVLYGSYTGDRWVDEPHTAKGYQSDYDLLVIVDQKELTDTVAYWQKANDRLIREYGITHALRTPVNFIVHTLQEVNDGLAHGRYFFMDLAKDGIALYQSDDRELHKPRPKTPIQSAEMAREYFDEWYPSAGEFFDDFRSNLDRGRYKKAAFELHQATERLYHCILLVTTFYTPHVHNLGFLRTQAERLDARLRDVWPINLRVDRARFEKLKEAYVKARYSKHYRISEEELTWLGARVEQLGQVVLTICQDRLAALDDAAGRAAG